MNASNLESLLGIKLFSIHNSYLVLFDPGQDFCLGVELGKKSLNPENTFFLRVDLIYNIEVFIRLTDVLARPVFIYSNCSIFDKLIHIVFGVHRKEAACIERLVGATLKDDYKND